MTSFLIFTNVEISRLFCFLSFHSFCNTAINTVNGVGSCVVVPVVTFGNCLPLCFCAFKGDFGQAIATIEYRITNTGDAIGNDDICQATAIVECIITDAGDTIGDGDTDQASTTAKC